MRTCSTSMRCRAMSRSSGLDSLPFVSRIFPRGPIYPPQQSACADRKSETDRHCTDHEEDATHRVSRTISRQLSSHHSARPVCDAARSGVSQENVRTRERRTKPERGLTQVNAGIFSTVILCRDQHRERGRYTPISCSRSYSLLCASGVLSAVSSCSRAGGSGCMRGLSGRAFDQVDAMGGRFATGLSVFPDFGPGACRTR